MTGAVQALGSIVLAIPALIAGASDPLVPILAAAAASLMAAAFCPSLARLQRISYARIRCRLLGMWQYGVPLALVSLAFAALAASDRLLILNCLGPAAAGAYSASYGIADRAVGLLFLSVTLATKPLVFSTHTEHGAKAASDLLARVGAWLMAIGFPVTTVLICAPSQIAGAMLGAGLTTAAATVLPWAAVGALLSAFLSLHFALSFQIARRTSWILLAVAPAVMLNGIGNVLLLPRFGIVAAGWSTVAGYTVALALTVWLGRRYFRVPFQLTDVLRTSIACVPVALFVQIDFPQTLSGFLLMLGGSGLIYMASAFALDVARIRSGGGHLYANLRTLAGERRRSARIDARDPPPDRGR
jgi:O-antigen/teichoic acid export membrane protein